MEDAKPNALPAHWESMEIGAPATFTTDTDEKHGGQSSVRIDAPVSTRAYVCSEKMPVAPGEELTGSAWVKVKDMQAKEGTCIMIAEFFDPTGQDSTVEKFDAINAAKPPQGWVKISGTIKVPETASSMRVRLGFSYAKGICWWDDVTVTAKTPLTTRLDLAEPRLSPAMTTIPVMILNRMGAKENVLVKVSLNKMTGEQRVALTGEIAQRAEVPVTTPKPGQVKAKVELFAGSSKEPVFSAEGEVQVPAPIVFPPVSPTHWAIEDGPATPIIGRVDLAVPDAQRKGATLHVFLKDAGGKVVGSWTSPAKDIPDGINDFTIDAKNLSLGDYTLAIELKPHSGQPLTGQQAWHVIPRRLAKVTFNDAGYPEYDGKAIFPMGLFNGGKFKEQGEAGFTVTHAYNAARIFPGPRPQDAEALRFLDDSGANGMKMVLMVPMRLVIQGDWDGVRRRVRMFRNHPALLAWDEEEGFARGDFKPDTLKLLYKLVKEEDPNHPFITGDSRDVITRMGDRSNFFPQSEMDAGMWWWYPFPLKARAADALNGEEADDGTNLVLPSFFLLTKTDKPVWTGLQSYRKPDPPESKGATKGKKGANKKQTFDLPDSRFPTEAEYRCQAYYAIVAGFKGLMWYGGSVTGGLFADSAKGNFDDLKKVVTELHGLTPVFMSPTVATPTATPGTAVSAIIKQAEGRLFLIAVNHTTKPAEVSLSSPEIKLGEATVLNENRVLRSGSGSIKDHFEPFGVHVYELKE